MTRIDFLHERKPAWDRFEQLIRRASGDHVQGLDENEHHELSEALRSIGHDLVHIRSERLGPALEEYVNDLVRRGHSVFYHSTPNRPAGFVRPLVVGFPRALRDNHVYFWAAAAVLVIPMIVSFGLVVSNPSLARRVLPEHTLIEMEATYVARGAPVSSETPKGGIEMTGYYLRNNISIALRCYALGIFAGVGTLYLLLANGIELGAVAGYVIARGHSDPFFAFVVSHSVIELSALAIAGAAGLVLGFAVIAPGYRLRREALAARGRDSFLLAGGASVLLVVAAVVEGFWSTATLPLAVKIAFAATSALGLSCYLLFAGRTVQRCE